MRHLKTTLAVLGAVTILVLASNTIAIAATGQGFLLGKFNYANKQTTLTRTTVGPVLKLNAKNATGTPLAVRGSGKVANLNADKVDGLDSSVLRNRSYVFTSTFSNKALASLTLPLPPGHYVISYSNFFDTVGTSELQCYVTADGIRTGYSSFLYTVDGWKPAMSGTGYVTKTAANTVKVECQAFSSTFSTVSYSPMQVIATPTVQAAAMDLTAARQAPGNRTAQH